MIDTDKDLEQDVIILLLIEASQRSGLFRNPDAIQIPNN